MQQIQSEFSFGFQVFVQFILTKTNVLYESIQVTFTFHSDLVFSENSYSKSVLDNAGTSAQQFFMSVFNLSMVTLCWGKDVKKNGGLVKIYYPSTQLFLSISALIKILKSLQVH